MRALLLTQLALVLEFRLTATISKGDIFRV
jgi:hypothetical protein